MDEGSSRRLTGGAAAPRRDAPALPDRDGLAAAARNRGVDPDTELGARRILVAYATGRWSDVGAPDAEPTSERHQLLPVDWIAADWYVKVGDCVWSFT